MYVYLATFERFQLVSTCKKSLYNFFQRKHKCMRFWQNTKTIFSYTKSSPNQFFMTSAYSDQNSASSSSHGKIHKKVDIQKSSFPVQYSVEYYTYSQFQVLHFFSLIVSLWKT